MVFSDHYLLRITFAVALDSKQMKNTNIDFQRRTAIKISKDMEILAD